MKIINIFCLIVSLLFYGELVPTVQAAGTCNTRGGISMIGIEFVVDHCIAEGTNDNTVFHYVDTALECSGGKVSNFANYGDELTTPANIINAWKSFGYKIFRNEKGTHIVAVDYRYSGTIDDLNLPDYAAGSVNTDLISYPFIPPSPLPDCDNSDYNSCNMEVESGSTTNVGTGRLSHSQPLFSGGSDSSLSANMDIYYRSLGFSMSSMGYGWRHNYEIYLQQGPGGQVTFYQGGRKRKYTLSGVDYLPEQGDYSSLTINPDSTAVIVEKNGTRYEFNSNWKVTAIVDRNGNTLAFAYSGGNLQTVTDTAGRVTTFAYDLSNRLTNISDPAGNSFALVYTGDYLSSITYPDGGQWSYSHDANGLLLSRTDPQGNTTTYNYDTNKRMTTSNISGGSVRTVGYAPASAKMLRPFNYVVNSIPDKTTTIIMENGGQWSYTYDLLTEKLVSKTDPLGNTSTYAYDANGNLISKTDPDGGITAYTYDTQGNMLSLTDPLGSVTVYTYNAFGQILTVSDPVGNVTTNAYDLRGNLLSVTDSMGATTSYEYDAKGNRIKIIDALLRETLIVYDIQNNPLAVTGPDGAVTAYTYDSMGNVTSVTDAAGNLTAYEYDVMGRTIKITDPLGNVQRYTYDSKGNVINETDPNGNSTAYTYNHRDLATAITDPLGDVTALTYGGTGCPACGSVDKLTSVTDAKGNKTVYTYDLSGRLIEEKDALNKITSYTYDSAGRLLTKTDANNHIVNYSYDAAGRLVSKTYPDSSSVTYTYDAEGKLLTAANQDMSYTFVYDADERIVSATNSKGMTINYQYDAVGNRTQLSMSGQAINYSYDAANRMTQTAFNSQIFNFHYDAAGRRTRLDYPNGKRAEYTYDNANRLINVLHKNSAGILFNGNIYTYDAVGNRLTNLTKWQDNSYQYDAVYRLLGRTDTSVPQETYSYDALGNRLSSQHSSTYSYNAGNQLLSTDSTNYSYDNNGNLIQKVYAAGTTSYYYDYENRLSRVERIEGPGSVNVYFKYDPFGRRISKRIDNNGTVTTTNYFYDREDILFEYNDMGVAGKVYIHGPGIDELLAIKYQGVFYYYHAGGDGSILYVSNPGGGIAQEYRYDAFGNLLTAAIDQPYTYTGREWDKETGLYFYRNRYYDPEPGRFINKDPIGFAGGDANLYSYVQQNPVNYTDPWGLKPNPTCVAACTLGGSIVGGGAGYVGGGLLGGAGCTLVAPGVGTVACGVGGAEAGGAALSAAGGTAGYAIGQAFCPVEEEKIDCNEHFTRCLDSRLIYEPGPVYGTNRCETCRDQCVQNDGVWPDIARTFGGAVRCDYKNFK